MATDPFVPLEIVLVDRDCRDRALDEEMDTARYEKERDPALIVERTGCTAMRFRIGRIARSFLMEHVESAKSHPERCMLALLAACHQYTDEHGKAHTADTIESVYKQRLAADAWIEEIGDLVGSVGLMEIGRVALARARLPKAR